MQKTNGTRRFVVIMAFILAMMIVCGYFFNNKYSKISTANISKLTLFKSFTLISEANAATMVLRLSDINRVFSHRWGNLQFVQISNNMLNARFARGVEAGFYFKDVRPRVNTNWLDYDANKQKLESLVGYEQLTFTEDE